MNSVPQEWMVDFPSAWQLHEGKMLLHEMMQVQALEPATIHCNRRHVTRIHADFHVLRAAVLQVNEVMTSTCFRTMFRGNGHA